MSTNWCEGLLPVTIASLITFKDLIELTKKQKCRYLGSTSSMTSVLSHIHFLLTNWKPVNFESLSEDFQGMSDNFSYSTKLPGAIVLRKVGQESSETTEEPIYAIDKDKSYDLEEDNVLLWVGTQLEKQLTMPTDEFSGLLRANPITDTVKEKMTEREAYHYSKVGASSLYCDISS
ncbi:Pet127-domain-containing protein [Wallemia mellicola]|nr:Pet127-domain-containing protein [Wallemia mellicola]